MPHDSTPRRFRWPVPDGRRHPNGSDERWRHGCYFPATQLLITDMGERGQGRPSAPGLEWIDDAPAEGPYASRITRPRPTMDEMLGRPEGLDQD